VAVVTFLSFLPALRGGFSWDDFPNFVENQQYRGLGWRELRWMFTTTLQGHYVPVTWVSFGLSYVIGGMKPWGYHLVSVALHAANAALFYFVSRRLLATAFGGGVTGLAALAHGSVDRDVPLSLGAAFAALMFGVHPLRAESVAWVTERRDVLCGLFYLVSILAYLVGVAHGGPIRKRWWILSLGAFTLALLSKAAAMPLPAALLLLDTYPLRRVRPVGWRPLVLEKMPYLLLAAGAGVLALIAQSRAHALTSYGHYGMSARVGMTAYNLAFYPWKLVWAADLSPLYELPRTVNPLAWRFLFPLVAFLAISALLVALRRRVPGALAAWVYSALLVLPVTGAVAHAGIQLAADRYSYLSGLGFAVLAGGGLAWLLGERERLKPSVVGAVLVVAVLVIAGWAAGSWRQSKAWHDHETLWRYAVAVDPDCAGCAINLGVELISASRDPERIREAEGLFRRGLRLDPDRAYTYHDLGITLVLQHRYDEAEAAFREFMRRDPSDASGPADLGLLRLAQERHAEAVELLRRALAMDPSFPGLRGELAKALRGRGEELREANHELEASPLFAEAEALDRQGPRGAVVTGQRSAITTGR
jgi:tetratricopeptide (TPR) repeat protein